MSRLSEDDYFMGIADLVSRRSTCPRRNVGCVILDRYNHIVATGHNGVPRGVIHCIDHPCAGANQSSGEALDLCQAVHAEANALMQCSDVMSIGTIYCTTYPCIQCLKMIMNTSCEELVYRDPYPSLNIQRLLSRFIIREYKHGTT